METTPGTHHHHHLGREADTRLRYATWECSWCMHSAGSDKPAPQGIAQSSILFLSCSRCYTAGVRLVSSQPDMPTLGDCEMA